MNILFVCTGNSCRSVMAEGLLKDRLKERASFFRIGSAGISALEGVPASAETVRVMSESGIDVSGHRSRQLTAEMVREADRIFVMEEIHRQIVLGFVREAAPKTFLLTDFKTPHANGRREPTLGVPDPIRMPDGFYQDVFGVISDCVGNIARTLGAGKDADRSSGGS